MNDFTYQETLALAKQIEEELAKGLIVPPKFKSINPSVKRTKEHFKTLKPEYWSPLMSTEKGFLRIRVTKQHVSRALRFYDAFIKLVTSRGHEFTISGHSNYVTIRDVNLKVRLRETERVMDVPKKREWDGRTMEPTGNFCLSNDPSPYPHKEWYDTNHVKLEEKLSVIMAYLELKADAENRWRESVELNRQIREREEELRRNREKLIAKE